jgi:hypothetical protein
MGGIGPASVKSFLAIKVRTDQRWLEGVGDGGERPGSTAKARRSLDVAHRS